MVTRVLVALVLIAVISAPALALDPMGAPKAEFQKGTWGLGIEYIRTETDLLRKTANWSDAKQTAEGTFDKLYANLGYGIADNVTGFVRLGAGRADFDRKADWTTWEGDGDIDLIYGGGFKATLVQEADVAWGMLAQISRGKYTGDTESSVDGEEAEYEVKLYEVQIAAGPTVQVSDTIQVYGGPFIHMASGDYLDIKDDGDKLYKPIDEKNIFGGYVGVLAQLECKAALTAEFQYTGDAWALAAGVMFPF